MLEYQKTILDKISFNKNLFYKEFIKSYKWLNTIEIEDLVKWVRIKYSNYFNELVLVDARLKINDKRFKFVR